MDQAPAAPPGVLASPPSPRSVSSTSEPVQDDSQTQIDSNIEYYYTDSDSEPEDAKDKARIAEETRNKHREFFARFIKSTEKLRTEYATDSTTKERSEMDTE